MRNLFLAGTAAFLLSGGLALAAPPPPGGTDVNVPVVKNAAALGASSAATTGGESVNSVGNNVNSGNTLVKLGDIDLRLTSTHQHLDVTAQNHGSVGEMLFVGFTGRSERGGSSGALIDSGSAVISHSVNGSQGMVAVQNNSGTASLQQNSQSLGSAVAGGFSSNF